VGGTREPLIPAGAKLATSDPDLAARLADVRLKELRELQRAQQDTGRVPAPSLAGFARDHLIAKKRAGNVTDGWLAATEGFLKRAVAFFGAERGLDRIRPSEVRGFAEWLTSQPARKPKERKEAGSSRTMTTYTVRAHLFALSNLYRRAQESELVPVGFNPVAALMEKPAVVRKEAKWLEVHEAALLLESARTLPVLQTAAGAAIGASLAHPFLATFLLTGGRYHEVLGLELDDVSFDRKTVTFRPNAFRRLKTQTSWRVVPLFPQLEAILRAWVFGPRLEAGGTLLFPAPGSTEMLSDTRKLLDRIAKRAGWKRGEIRHRIFRHTYCAARLQTLDRGAPVSLYVVSRELGHGSEEMYSHLGAVRHRSEVVEYRVERHYERLGDQLIRLAFDITSVIKQPSAEAKEDPRDTQVSAGEDLPEWARRDSNARPLAPEAGGASAGWRKAAPATGIEVVVR
jgi:integrase